MPCTLARWAWLILSLSVIACAALPTPTPAERSGGPPSADATDRTLDAGEAVAALWPILEPAERDLLTVVGPEEWIEATVDVADSKQAAALATAGGLTVELVNRGTVLVTGPRNDVLAFTASVTPTRVELNEDHRPDRWLPEAKPTVVIANSGSPYRFAPLVVDRTKLNMNENHRADLLSELARAITTIDGLPYERLAVDGWCDPGEPPVCQLRASGVAARSGGRIDEYLITSDETTGGTARLSSSSLSSMPRDLARAAEWIARHDAAAISAIAAFDSCCGALWDPTRPGVIALYLWRECVAAVVPDGREVADTGDCLDSLEIVVDVGRASVDSIQTTLGP